ncbi:DUF397 domain-containing protein [Nocardia callitridis]|uniref:DUF397 domain-containing protein n=1 Tax=Nocardia callitridis TaxID=648753 RepID=A0ABP9JTU6_9NOCA
MTRDLSEPNWFKSSYSQSGGDCVEVAHLPEDTVGVRDSKNPTGPALSFTPTAWDAFTTHIQRGHFNPPT